MAKSAARGKQSNVTPASPTPRTAGRKSDRISKHNRVRVMAINPQHNTNTCGYYNHIRRREEDVFWIRGNRYDSKNPDTMTKAQRKKLAESPDLDGQLIDFSPAWMELVEADTPGKLTTLKQSMRKTHDRILAEQNPNPGGSGNDPEEGSEEDDDEDDDEDDEDPLNA